MNKLGAEAGGSHLLLPSSAWWLWGQTELYTKGREGEGAQLTLGKEAEKLKPSPLLVGRQTGAVMWETQGNSSRRGTKYFSQHLNKAISPTHTLPKDREPSLIVRIVPLPIKQCLPKTWWPLGLEVYPTRALVVRGLTMLWGTRIRKES